MRKKKYINNLSGQKILITGCNSGIGLALAKELLKSGNYVFGVVKQNSTNISKIKSSNLNWLFKRELIVSILNGIFLSILISIVTYFWFQELLISILICAAIVINLISSVIAGIFVPIILNKLNQDPAIAGSVVVTTVTDVIGFFSFLGLATIFLVN